MFIHYVIQSVNQKKKKISFVEIADFSDEVKKGKSTEIKRDFRRSGASLSPRLHSPFTG